MNGKKLSLDATVSISSPCHLKTGYFQFSRFRFSGSWLFLLYPPPPPRRRPCLLPRTYLGAVLPGCGSRQSHAEALGLISVMFARRGPGGGAGGAASPPAARRIPPLPRPPPQFSLLPNGPLASGELGWALWRLSP